MSARFEHGRGPCICWTGETLCETVWYKERLLQATLFEDRYTALLYCGFFGLKRSTIFEGVHCRGQRRESCHLALGSVLNLRYAVCSMADPCHVMGDTLRDKVYDL